MTEFVALKNAWELDAFVEQQPNGHFMQTSLWGRVKRDWPWTGMLLRDESGRILGTMALLRHDLRRLPGCFYYAPRGPIVAPGDRRSFAALVQEAATWTRKRGAIFLRIDPEIGEQDEAFAGFVRSMGFRVDQASDFSLFQPRLCYVSSLAGKDPKTLEGTYRSSTRCNVHKALRSPLTVRLGGTNDLPAFCRMMEKTAAKNGFQPRPQAYFQAFLEGLGPCARLYLAELNDRPVAASLAVAFGQTCSLCYGCSEEAGDKLHANELLEWQMQTDAIRLGCTRFDFRGVEGFPEESNPHYGLHHFKRGFGAEFHAYIGQLDLPLRRTAYAFTRALLRLRDQAPEPKGTERLHSSQEGEHFSSSTFQTAE